MKLNKTVFLICLISFSNAIFISCRKNELYLDRLKPEIKLEPNDARFSSPLILFSKDTVYLIGNSIEIKAGQILEIEAGTLIKVKNRVSVTILQGAKILANGEADAPIVFTSDAAVGTQGVIGSDGTGTNFWYGLRIYGTASTQPAFNSGVIKYMRIEFAGGDENFRGLPSLLFEDVSESMEINHVQVSYSFANHSFGFSGGNCNATHLISYASNGNDFVFDNSFKGNLQNLLAYRHPFFPVLGPGPNLAGIYITGSGTFPALSNITVLGPDAQKGNSLTYSERDPSASLLIAGNAKFKIRNSVFMSFPKAAFYMNSRNSALALNTGESEFTHSFVHSLDSTRVFYLPRNIYPPFTSGDFKNFMLEPGFNNEFVLMSKNFLLKDPFDYDNTPDPFPGEGSPLLNGANFTGTVFSNPFFSKVSYRGALGTDNWFDGWVNFIPLQTDYNNK